VSLTREEVIRYLEGLPAEELGALADAVLARLGLPPSAAPGPSLVTMGAAVPEPKETIGQPEFDVVLRAHGADKLAVVRIARRALGPEVGLQETKRLVESAPVVLGEHLSRGDAEELAQELRRAGAEVELR
jgi:large subunit ribosomal protein L7/L12